MLIFLSSFCSVIEPRLCKLPSILHETSCHSLIVFLFHPSLWRQCLQSHIGVEICNSVSCQPDRIENHLRDGSLGIPVGDYLDSSS